MGFSLWAPASAGRQSSGLWQQHGKLCMSCPPAQGGRGDGDSRAVSPLSLSQHSSACCGCHLHERNLSLETPSLCESVFSSTLLTICPWSGWARVWGPQGMGTVPGRILTRPLRCSRGRRMGVLGVPQSNRKLERPRGGTSGVARPPPRGVWSPPGLPRSVSSWPLNTEAAEGPPSRDHLTLKLPTRQPWA